MSRRSARALTIASLETLEDRITLSAAPVNLAEQLVDAKASPIVGVVYAEYVEYFQSGSHGAFVTAQSAKVEMVGPTIGVDIQFNSGTDFQANAAQMQQLGMVVTAEAPGANTIEGFMPIFQLPAVAENPNLVGVTPVYKPTALGNPTTPNIPGAATVPGTPATSPTATVSPYTGLVTSKGGPALGSIYQEFANYYAAGAVGAFTPTEAKQIEFAGDAVGVDVRTSPANFSAMLGAMKADGMLITAVAPQAGVIEGFVPIAALPFVAVNGDTVGISPVYKPTTNGTSFH